MLIVCVHFGFMLRVFQRVLQEIECNFLGIIVVHFEMIFDFLQGLQLEKVVGISCEVTRL